MMQFSTGQQDNPSDCWCRLLTNLFQDLIDEWVAVNLCIEVTGCVNLCIEVTGLVNLCIEVTGFM